MLQGNSCSRKTCGGFNNRAWHAGAKQRSHPFHAHCIGLRLYGDSPLFTAHGWFSDVRLHTSGSVCYFAWTPHISRYEASE